MRVVAKVHSTTFPTPSSFFNSYKTRATTTDCKLSNWRKLQLCFQSTHSHDAKERIIKIGRADEIGLTVSFEVAQFLRNRFGNISRTFVWRPGKSRTELLSGRRAGFSSSRGCHRTRTRACVRTNNHASRGDRNCGRFQGSGKSEGRTQHSILLLLMLMLLMLMLLLLLLLSGCSGSCRSCKIMGMMQAGPACNCSAGYAGHAAIGSARSGKRRARGQGYTSRRWGHRIKQRCARPIVAEIEKADLRRH